MTNSLAPLICSGLPLPALLVMMEREQRQRSIENRLALYQPYPKQQRFHAEGAVKRERLLRAGNQLGKTYSGAAEMAYHLTGEYPDWWQGRRWDRPIEAWAGGKDGISVRDSLVKLLLGPADARGTGFIPKRAIVGDPASSRNAPGSIDNVVIRHKSGDSSHLTFKTYLQGREQWQAASLDLVWLDEEPSLEIYTEALSRTNATGGMLYMTFTPLLGMSSVVRRFLMEASPDRSDTNLTIDDAEHIPLADRQKIIASYPAHEREARTLGIPALGSGRIFPVAEQQISVAGFKIPDHWRLIGGLDFGWDHPFAAVKLAYDGDNDAIYVVNAYRQSQALPAIHCAAIKAWGADMPWAWPHDGYATEKGSGEQLRQQYRGHSLRMLPEHAQFPGDRGNSVDAGLVEMHERMETARFFVFSHLADWFDEFRLYHRKDGKVVKQADDLMDATRYAMMCIGQARIASPKTAVKPFVPRQVTPQARHGFLGI